MNAGRPILQRCGVQRGCFAASLRHKGKSLAQRPFSLQPHNQVKEFHPPSNGEAIADVTTKHGIYRRRNLEELRWCQKNFDEFLARVPRFHETQINVHGTINQAFIVSEQASRSPWVIEHFVQNIGRLFAGEDGKKNAAAEDWINETGRITREQPAITSELLAP